MIAGALTTGALDWIAEHYWYSKGQPDTFPFVDTPIAPVDDLLVGGVLPGIIAAVGYATDKESVKDFGLGGLMYGGANILKLALLRQITFK